jgi:hypothetical protein
VAADLGPLLGGAEAAERYLELLVIPADAQVLARAAAEAREIAVAGRETYRRWCGFRIGCIKNCDAARLERVA